MDAPVPTRQVVFTNKAQCRDCYRCVRVCPVKAIRMHDGQASVIEQRCIGCGTCVRECPQGAKCFRNDLERVKRFLAEGGKLAASLAPSFSAVYTDWRRGRIPSALRQLGFSYVGETAIGAYYAAQATAQVAADSPTKPWICTACPAAVRYVERYRPELIPFLMPVVSPMIAHAKRIKEKFGDEIKTVFIGPCIAKKAEADRPEFDGLVDCVLTYQELEEWFDSESIDLSACEESDFDEKPEGFARLFALEGGCLRTAGWSDEMFRGEMAAVSGFEEMRLVLNSLQEDTHPMMIEPLFCPLGCVNGPGVPVKSDNLFVRRVKALQYAEDNPGEIPHSPQTLDLRTPFVPRPEDVEVEFSEEQIRHALEITGKTRLEDQLNCGACGYPSCREKAIAVLRGLAVPEMCLPRMRRLAEQRVDRIIDTSPNGIVILDDQLHILSMNPAFRKFFTCSDAVAGLPISYLMDPEPFERLAAGQENVIEAMIDHRKYGVYCHQIMYKLLDEKQYVGIFVNLTNTRMNQEQLDRLREQTVMQARELLDHQLKMAEKIAGFLGESAAKGENLVERLMQLAGDESEINPKSDKQWLRDTYTSK